jgi:hypothetical protein
MISGPGEPGRVRRILRYVPVGCDQGSRSSAKNNPPFGVFPRSVEEAGPLACE